MKARAKQESHSKQRQESCSKDQPLESHSKQPLKCRSSQSGHSTPLESPRSNQRPKQWKPQLKAQSP